MGQKLQKGIPEETMSETRTVVDRTWHPLCCPLCGAGLRPVAMALLWCGRCDAPRLVPGSSP